MLNISDTHISVVDINQLDKPVTASVIEVAPYVSQLFRFGDYMVEHINLGAYSSYSWGGYNNYASEFRIKKIVPGTALEDTPQVASFLVGQVSRVLKWKDKLVLFRRVVDSSASRAAPTTPRTRPRCWSTTCPTRPSR